MKISGLCICRNVIRFHYPIVEAIRFALPIVDEFVVNVGQSDDGTLDLIRAIGSEMIRIVKPVWDDSMKTDGLLLSRETNVALSRDRALYLQADEVLHEADYDRILRRLHENLSNPSVLGFTFRYLHFYGDYRSCNPLFYRRACASSETTASGIVRRRGGIPIEGGPGYRDASGCYGRSDSPVSGVGSGTESMAGTGFAKSS